jgi:peroxiredoxin
VNVWRQAAGLFLILAVTVVACSGPGSAVARGIAEGNLARDFTLETLDGTKVSLSDFEGNVVLVNFWATWCPPCRAEIPGFDAAYQAYKDEGFVVLGINVEESPGRVAPFVEEFQVTYPVLLDEKGKVVQEWRARGLPMSLVIDRDGVIQVRHIGFLSAQKLEEYLEGILP